MTKAQTLALVLEARGRAFLDAANHFRSALLTGQTPDEALETLRLLGRQNFAQASESVDHPRDSINNTIAALTRQDRGAA
jgi:hypothetical protein